MNCRAEWAPYEGWIVTGHVIPRNGEKCIRCGLPYEDLEYFLSKSAGRVVFGKPDEPQGKEP